MDFAAAKNKMISSTC